jgi:hypothetical protein
VRDKKTFNLILDEGLATRAQAHIDGIEIIDFEHVVNIALKHFVDIREGYQFDQQELEHEQFEGTPLGAKTDKPPKA